MICERWRYHILKPLRAMPKQIKANVKLSIKNAFALETLKFFSYNEQIWKISPNLFSNHQSSFCILILRMTDFTRDRALPKTLPFTPKQRWSHHLDPPHDIPPNINSRAATCLKLPSDGWNLELKQRIPVPPKNTYTSTTQGLGYVDIKIIGVRSIFYRASLAELEKCCKRKF